MEKSDYYYLTEPGHVESNRGLRPTGTSAKDPLVTAVRTAVKGAA